MPRVFSLIVAAAYLGVCISYLRLFLSEGDKPIGGARLLAYVAVFLHAVYFLALGLTIGHPPMTNVFEALTTLALMLAAIYLYLEQRSNTVSTGTPIFFMVFGLQLVSSIFMDFSHATHRAIGSPLLVAHIFLALIGYTAFAVAFLYSIMYLLLHRELRSGKFSLLFRKLPSLEELDEMNFRATLIGAVALFAAVVLGFAWSEAGFGQLPFGDAKVMVTLFTWLLYIVVLVFKTLFGWHGKRIAILSLCGFILVVLSLALVNQLPATFHNMY